jgi:hypothetical protein
MSIQKTFLLISFLSLIFLYPVASSEAQNIEKFGCISGDCITGFGIIQLSTGNRYEGDFSKGKMQREGIYAY